MNEDRLYPARPFLAVSAIIRRGRQVLLVQRGHEPLKGVWSFPGGLVKTGETLQQAAARELAEETGISARFTGEHELREIIIADDTGRTGHHYVLVVFPGDYQSGTLRAGGDAAAAQWVNQAQAGELELTDGALQLITRFTGD